jgi:hypothetical protein
VVVAGRVDRARTREFDPGAMPQPSHIYASTLHRRGRRWRRRRRQQARPVWPAAALSALLVLGAAVVLAALA